MKKTILTAIVFIITMGLFAQTGTLATGGEISGSGGVVSYSIGQVAIQTHTGKNGSITEGLQQPYEISVEIGIKEVGISLNILAYPNPTTNFLKLKVDDTTRFCIQEMQYQLFDMQGKLLQSEKLTGNETQINMSTYIPAIYFVRVLSNNKSIKEFKIIKNL